MKCTLHDLEVIIGSNLSRVELGVHGTSIFLKRLCTSILVALEPNNEQFETPECVTM